MQGVRVCWIFAIVSCRCNPSVATRIKVDRSDEWFEHGLLGDMYQGGVNLLKGFLGDMEGEATNLIDSEEIGREIGSAAADAIDAEALGTHLGQGFVEGAAPGLQEAAAEGGRKAVEQAIHQLVNDPNTAVLVQNNVQEGVSTALSTIASDPNVQPFVAETTGTAANAVVDTLVAHPVSQYAVWAVSGAMMLSVMQLGVGIWTAVSIKRGFAKIEKALKKLEATLKECMANLYDKLDEIKDVLQLSQLNEMSDQIQMSWQSMKFCLNPKYREMCEKSQDFQGLATVEKRDMIAMGLQKLDKAIRGEPDGLKLTKVDLVVRIVNIALKNGLNHQQVRAAAWSYWGELLLLQVKGAAILEYMSQSQALKSELWGSRRIRVDLKHRLRMQRIRIKSVFDSLEVEGYYLRSRKTQSCLAVHWAFGTLDFKGDCTTSNDPTMTFNVVPMQAVHGLPFAPGQRVEYRSTKAGGKWLRGVVKNFFKDGSENEFIDIDYPDGSYMKKGAFAKETRHVWSVQENRQFFLRHKKSKRCMRGSNVMGNVAMGSLRMNDTMLHLENADEANVSKHLFHLSPADLDGSFYFDYVDSKDSETLKCIKPYWYEPSKLGSKWPNRMQPASKPCQSKSDPYPRLAFEMVFASKKTPASASMSLPWSSLRPKTGKKSSLIPKTAGQPISTESDTGSEVSTWGYEGGLSTRSTFIRPSYLQVAKKIS